MRKKRSSKKSTAAKKAPSKKTPSKTKKASSKAKAPAKKTPSKRNIKKKKPSGVRPEDVSPFRLFKYKIDDDEEIHLSIPHEHKYRNLLYTIKLNKNGKDCFEYSSIVANNDWDHKIEYIDDKVVRVEVVGGKCIANIFTKRRKSKAEE